MTATYCGSPLYTSPEIILKRPYLGPECDVWSLGVILYTMLTATMPFDDSNFPKFMQQVEIGEYPEPLGVSNGERLLSSSVCVYTVVNTLYWDELCILKAPYFKHPILRCKALYGYSTMLQSTWSYGNTALCTSLWGEPYKCYSQISICLCIPWQGSSVGCICCVSH